MNVSFACAVTKKVWDTGISRITLLLLILSSAAFAAETGQAAKVAIDPMPASVITGYSEAMKFRGPNALYVDRKRGELWVGDAGNRQVVGFDSRGIPFIQFRHSAINSESNEVVPAEPRGIAVDSTGRIFVSDGVSDKVTVYDYRGRMSKRIDVSKLIGDRAQPWFLDIDSEDNLYVCDTVSQSLLVLNKDFELARTVNLKRPRQPNQKEERVSTVTAMDIGPDGKIYVLNSLDKPCVRVLDPDGHELLAFGDIDAGWDNFQRPCAITAVDDGTFWVSDAGMHAVKQYDKQGKFLQYVGGGPGLRPGEMRGPYAVTTDGKDKLYVGERGTNRIQIFSLKPKES